MKCLCRDLQPGPDRHRPRPMEDALEAVLNTFAITFGDRWHGATTH